MRRFAFLLPFLTTATFATTPAPATPPLALGESRPVETALGDPALPATRDVWVEMIRGAKRTLDLEEFYFSHRRGESLQPIVDEIGRAAARGVKVRLLMDAGFMATYPQPAESIGALPNVTLRRVDYRRLAGGVQHAKFFIVDGSDSWLGSQNLDWRSLSQIHELGMRVSESALAGAMTAVFESDWAGADTTRAFAPAAYAAPAWPVRVVQAPRDTAQVWFGASPRATTPAGIPWDRDLIVQRLAAAKVEVVVQVLQYGLRNRGGGDSTLHHALLGAAARGVKVKLIVSDWAIGGSNEPALRDLAAHANVEVKISRVPEWSGGYVPFARVEHCKYMVVDSDWLWLGTSNWEPSYFLTTRNVGLTIHDAALARQARSVFDKSWSAPTAAAWLPDTKLPARVHGMDAPAGMKVYGE
jgi:phosphatidylserine/phosphatidylglycerophosphate/cardiolipin synthase-like enzyme